MDTVLWRTLRVKRLVIACRRLVKTVSPVSSPARDPESKQRILGHARSVDLGVIVGPQTPVFGVPLLPVSHRHLRDACLVAALTIDR